MTAVVEVVSLLVAFGAAVAAWRSAGSSKRSADAASKTGEAAERSAGSAERMVAAAERAEEERVILSLVPHVERPDVPQLRLQLATLSEPFRSRQDEILARAVVRGKQVEWALRNTGFTDAFPQCREMLHRIATGQDPFGERPAGTVT